ncbi:Rrf2 family transcriptional regulator [Tissierella sp. MSJ-40]|uniref:Rrf2 family transcriptional regulator n=1 Tax=Tissierella simiarum TaxID=2841534 RepID=A0ABS6EBF9_9FIRM|nr:Rrf2 family transcriptional regulator [Tissierella simiarum]MBU5440201.1 Rrf2 family transcriptional regulator [Tissierella simiarum]
MKLSTRGRYGLKAMFQLALHYGEGPIPLKYVADEQNLSESYLEQLFSTLRKEGLLNSVRGAQGGYMLSRAPEEITVGNILRVLEGNLAPSDCVIDEEFECEKEDKCVTKLVWVKIRDSIDEVVDSITLKDMVDDQINMKSKL